MNRQLVITLIGPDRPGIVERLAEQVLRHEGEWVESRMANLGGQFAGILRVSLPADHAPALIGALQGLDGLQLSVADAGEAEDDGVRYRLGLLGQDRPGIVHRVTAALAAGGASVEDMETEVIEASMSGEKLFRAEIELRLADAGSVEDLRAQLETIADELIVDIELD
jgi:glycine cleavage system regulatory protein